jgi:hypothetical protein
MPGAGRPPTTRFAGYRTVRSAVFRLRRQFKCRGEAIVDDHRLTVSQFKDPGGDDGIAFFQAGKHGNEIPPLFPETDERCKGHRGWR